jgi:hypothetical protein
MSRRIAALLDRTEAEQQEPTLPKDSVRLCLLQMFYRGELKATSQQMRAAIEALPFEVPKFSAVGVGYMTSDTFAERLDRAIARSDRAKLIEGRAERVEDQ